MDGGETMGVRDPVVAAESGVVVLHVDDDPGRLRLTERRLHQSTEGFEVVTATDPRDALGLVDDVDCIVSDYEMAPMNGLEFLEAVRERRPNVPFILFTGRGDETVASDAIGAGVTDYVVKDDPEEYRVLARRIANAVRRQRAETRMQEGFRAIERASEGIALLDAAHEFTYVNPAFADAFQYDREAFDGETWRRLFPESEADHLSETVLPLLDVQDSWSGEVTAERRTGSEFIANVSIGRLTDGGLLLHVRDVTEHLEQQRRLELSRARYQTFTKDVLDSMDVGVLVYNPGFEVAWANEALTTTLGVDRRDLIGRSRDAFVDAMCGIAEEPTTLQTPLEEAYEENVDVLEFEFRVRTPDGDGTRWLQHWSRPIERGLFDGGRIEHYTDITDRKRRQRELERQNERLDRFASVVSHDLKNPLSVSKGFVEVLDETGDTDVVPDIERSLERMETLIEDVLTLAREGETVEEPAPVELETVVKRAWRHVETEDASLDVVDEPVVMADELRVQEVFENLLQNAVAHGGSDVSIEVGALPDGFYVTDDGPGIPPAERDSVFDAGYSTVERGTGFGLNIVREIARAHGWDVDVTASSSGGARFEFVGVTMHSTD